MSTSRPSVNGLTEGVPLRDASRKGPIRASKQRAIENIKKLVAEMNTYDDNGVLYEEDAIPHTSSSVESTKITLEEAKKTFAKSSYTPKILALIPTEFRNALVEYDSRIEYCFDALNSIVDMYEDNEEPLNVVWSARSVDFVTAYNFYKHYSEDAIQYILNQIVEFEGGEEYDEEEDDGFMEKHYPATSRSYADKPNPELLKKLMGAAYTPEAFAKIMKNY
jgi:hypothetical protein